MNEGFPKKKDDSYITLLKYLRGKLNEGQSVHFTEAFDHVHSLHSELKGDAFRNVFFQAMELVANQAGVGSNSEDRIKNNIQYVLNLDSYFHLLKHNELHEARQASRIATWIAGAALLIAGSDALVAAIKATVEAIQ